MGAIGAGFAGLAAAVAFRRAGHSVTVFEKTDGVSTAGGAISLAPNALACLSILAVGHRISTEPCSHLPATVRTSDGRVLVLSILAQLTGGDRHTNLPRSQLIAWLKAELSDDCVRGAVPATEDAVVLSHHGPRDIHCGRPA